jgi:hypothetical protein
MNKDEALTMCLEYIETNKHERKYVRHAIKAALEQPVQEPVGEVVEVNNDGFRCEFNRRLAVGTKLYTTPPASQRKPLTDDVLVPLETLEAAASSLDSFCGDLGWGDADLQNMDNLFAVIEQHKAAHGIKEKTND